jgi:MFS transporter, PCFT/HCP family, solute carrier family 46 (folate transporter), member 1
MSLSAQTAAFIGVPIGSKLMEMWSPWVPLTIVLFLGPLNVLLVLFMPETLAMAVDNEVQGSSQTAALSADQGWWLAMKTQTRESIRDAQGSFGMLKNWSLALVVFCLIIQAPINVEFLNVFIPYYSIHYDRPLAEAGYIISIRGGLVMLVMGVLLPLATSLLTPARTHISAFRRDRMLARASAVFIPVGILLVAGPAREFVVAGFVVMTLGSGLSPLCRALITELAGPRRTSRLFTLLSVLEGLAALPGGPLFAWAFSAGMRWGGVWLGLPFYLIALMGVAAAAALFALRGGVEVAGAVAADDATAAAPLSSSVRHPVAHPGADSAVSSVEV